MFIYIYIYIYYYFFFGYLLWGFCSVGVRKHIKPMKYLFTKKLTGGGQEVFAIDVYCLFKYFICFICFRTTKLVLSAPLSLNDSECMESGYKLLHKEDSGTHEAKNTTTQVDFFWYNLHVLSQTDMFGLLG